MKLEERIKRVITKRIVLNCLESVPEDDMFQAMLFLRVWNGKSKLIPYKLFEEGHFINYKSILNTPQGHIFRHWLLFNTVSIEKPFNKSRKIVRKIKDLEDMFIYVNMSNLFGTDLQYLFGVFFIDTEKAETFTEFDFENSEWLKQALQEISTVLALVLYLDGLEEVEVLERVLDICMSYSKNEANKKLLEYIQSTSFPLSFGVPETKS